MATANVNTQVSGAGSITVDPYGSVSAAPGAQGPGGNLSVAHSALIIIGGSMIALVALGILFRREVKIS